MKKIILKLLERILYWAENRRRYYQGYPYLLNGKLKEALQVDHSINGYLVPLHFMDNVKKVIETEISQRDTENKKEWDDLENSAWAKAYKAMILGELLESLGKAKEEVPIEYTTNKLTQRRIGFIKGLDYASSLIKKQ